MRWLGVTRDITERKEAEAALSERSMQLALAGKAALVGSFAFDVAMDKTQISDGYAAIHGFPDGTTEIKRSEWQAVCIPRIVRPWRSSEAEPSATDGRSIVRSIVLFGPRGEVRWIESRYFCFVPQRWPTPACGGRQH